MSAVRFRPWAPSVSVSAPPVARRVGFRPAPLKSTRPRTPRATAAPTTTGRAMARNQQAAAENYQSNQHGRVADAPRAEPPAGRAYISHTLLRFSPPIAAHHARAGQRPATCGAARPDRRGSRGRAVRTYRSGPGSRMLWDPGGGRGMNWYVTLWWAGIGLSLTGLCLEELERRLLHA